MVSRLSKTQLVAARAHCTEEKVMATSKAPIPLDVDHRKPISGNTVLVTKGGWNTPIRATVNKVHDTNHIDLFLEHRTPDYMPTYEPEKAHLVVNNLEKVLHVSIAAPGALCWYFPLGLDA